MPLRSNLLREDGLAIFRQGRETRTVTPQSVTVTLPCVVLLSPKYPHNVGQTVRLMACYGFETILMTGDRVPLLSTDKSYRLPREERMRDYDSVQLIQYDDPFVLLPREAVPVAVEMRPNAERLNQFIHPENAAYFFGPEDGSIPGSVLKRCHKFVVIPTIHCLNLANAVGTVLYDRLSCEQSPRI